MKSHFFEQHVPQFTHIKLACMLYNYIYLNILPHNMQSLMYQLDVKFASRPLYDQIKTLSAFTSYVEECVRVAWGMCIQTPPMIIDCESTVYNPEKHKRFYNADKNSTDIIMHMWPVLVQSSGPVLVRGVVLT